jgi:hypothetical protein
VSWRPAGCNESLPAYRGALAGDQTCWNAVRRRRRSLAIVIALTVLVTGNNPPKPSTVPSLAALAGKLAIGAGLLVIAIRQRRKLGKPKPPKKPPKWQTHIDNMTPWFAIGLGPLTQPWG